MADNLTIWDELQRWVQNSWWGVALLAAGAVLPFVGKIAEGLKNLANIVRPPSADLVIEALRVGPLEKYCNVAIDPQEPVYPYGAQVAFNLRHNDQNAGEIRINRIEVKLDDYAKEATCPTLPGDRFFGAGTPPVKVYNVWVSGSGVSAVHYEDSEGRTHKGKTGDILALDPPFKLNLHKSEANSVESVQIIVLARDPGLYKLSVSLRYTTPKGGGEKKVTSFSICKP